MEDTSDLEVIGGELHHVTYGAGLADGTHRFRFVGTVAHDFDLYGFDVSPSGGEDCHHGSFVGCVAYGARDREANVDGFALGYGTQHDFRLEHCVAYDVFDGIVVSAKATTVDSCIAYDCWNCGYKLHQDAVRLVNCIGHDSENANVELDWDDQPGTVTLEHCTFVGGRTCNVWVENARDRLRMHNCILAGGAYNGLTFEQRDVRNYVGEFALTDLSSGK